MTAIVKLQGSIRHKNMAMEAVTGDEAVRVEWQLATGEGIACHV